MIGKFDCWARLFRCILHRVESQFVLLLFVFTFVGARPVIAQVDVAERRTVEKSVASAFETALYQQTGRTMKRVRSPRYLEQLCTTGTLTRPTGDGLLAFQTIDYESDEELEVSIKALVTLWHERGDSSHKPLVVWPRDFAKMQRFAARQCVHNQEKRRVLVAVFEQGNTNVPDWLKEWGQVFWP